MYQSLLITVSFTVLTETIFFLIASPRHWDFLVVCALINAITNLGLNLTLFFLEYLTGGYGLWYPVVTVGLEILVTAVEYLVYCGFLAQKPALRSSLLLKTILANSITCGIGIVLNITGFWY